MSHAFRRHFAVLSPQWETKQAQNLDAWRESFTDATAILGFGAETLDESVFEPVASTFSIAKIAMKGKPSALYIGSTLTDRAFQDLYAKGDPVEGTEAGGFTRVDYGRLAPTILLRPASAFSPLERRLCAGHELAHAQLILDMFDEGASREEIESSTLAQEICAYGTAGPIADAEFNDAFSLSVTRVAEFLIAQEHPLDTDVSGILEQSGELNAAFKDNGILWHSFKAIALTRVVENRLLQADEYATFAEILTGQKHAVSSEA